LLASAGTQAGAIVGAIGGGWVMDIWSDPTRKRASLFGWIASWAQALEFSTFAFYLPILFVLIGVSGILGSNLLTLGIYCVAIVSGLVGPQIVHRIGQRRLSQWGFGIVFCSLLVAGAAISLSVLWMVPVAAATMIWGHYWSAENVMTIPSMVAAPRYRGVASGFAYIHTKLPQFIGFMAATIILPEVRRHAEPAGVTGTQMAASVTRAG
jgi:hypothetical protein